RVSILPHPARLREATAVLEPLVASPPEDPDVRAEALSAEALLQLITRRFEAALRYIDEAEGFAQSRLAVFVVRLTRGLILPFGGQAEAGVLACQEATRL